MTDDGALAVVTALAIVGADGVVDRSTTSGMVILVVVAGAVAVELGRDATPCPAAGCGLHVTCSGH